jgi:tetratricopeptide (TPR) repeat protein
VAFELYSRANDIILRTTFRSGGGKLTDLVQAIDLLNQAVARDPLFLQAYCQLAFAHDWLYFYDLDLTPARLAMAEAAIQEAFRIRRNAGEAHYARAVHLYRGYRDFDGALAELEVARETLPNDSRTSKLMGYIQRRQGHWEESTRNLERAAQLDPRDIETLEELAANYAAFRRYAETKSWLARVRAVAGPDDVLAKLALLRWEFIEKADTRPLHQAIDSIRATNPAAVTSRVAQTWLFCALAERDAAAATEALNALDDSDTWFGDAVLVNRAFVEGLIARITNDEHKAQLAFTAARAEQEKVVQAQPDSPVAWCLLGMIDAGLRRKEEALREGWRAVDLRPVEKDAIDHKLLVQCLAVIAASVGEKDLACEQLAIAIRSPGFVSYPHGSFVSYGYGGLKLLPFWDPLRGEPCFEKIVASLAPK